MAGWGQGRRAREGSGKLISHVYPSMFCVPLYHFEHEFRGRHRRWGGIVSGQDKMKLSESA